MKAYSTKKIDNKYIVIGLSAERIESYFSEIASDLAQKKFDGTIVFDLLLSNGNNSRRFFSAQFADNKIQVRSIKKMSTVEEKIKSYTIEFFLKHKNMLKGSILTSNEIERILEQGSMKHEFIF